MAHRHPVMTPNPRQSGPTGRCTDPSSTRCRPGTPQGERHTPDPGPRDPPPPTHVQCAYWPVSRMVRAGQHSGVDTVKSGMRVPAWRMVRSKAGM